MKLRGASTNAERGARVVLGPAIAEEKKNAPSPEEIRKRAFEIHVEGGGIHGYDLDDWLQAERELQEKYSKNNDGGRRRNNVPIDTIVPAIAKTLFINKSRGK